MWKISSVLAVVLLATSIVVYFARPAKVEAQGNTAGWKVMAIMPDPAGASKLEAELLKGGWAVDSVNSSHQPGAYTIVVLKSRLVSQ
jgi:hypothetical protein